MHYINFSLADDLDVENVGKAKQQMEGETSNDEHIAIVDLDQNFKVFGDFTLFTTKVRKRNITLYCKRSQFYKCRLELISANTDHLYHNRFMVNR